MVFMPQVVSLAKMWSQTSWLIGTKDPFGLDGSHPPPGLNSRTYGDSAENDEDQCAPNVCSPSCLYSHASPCGKSWPTCAGTSSKYSPLSKACHQLSMSHQR